MIIEPIQYGKWPVDLDAELETELSEVVSLTREKPAVVIRQAWEIWKCRPPRFARDHWFVILSGHERLDNPHRLQVNGLACYKLQGEPKKLDVRLNGVDGFDGPTVCQCDFIFVLDKSNLHSCLGPVSWARQQAIKSKLKEVLRL